MFAFRIAGATGHRSMKSMGVMKLWRRLLLAPVSLDSWEGSSGWCIVRVYGESKIHLTKELIHAGHM